MRNKLFQHILDNCDESVDKRIEEMVYKILNRNKSMSYKNKVTLIGWYGGDKAVARTAWTSTQKDVESSSEESIRELIVDKLWNNKTGKPHKTPFERAIVEFNITCEQASHIHLLKHRLANINGESARYMELKEDKHYIPTDWGDVVLSEDVGIYKKGTPLISVMESYTGVGNELYHQSLRDLQGVLGRKRAKESARFFKTMNSQLNLSVMMNMSCFSNFIYLRNAPDAQKEIREIASEMVALVKNIEGEPFKYVMEAFELQQQIN